MAERKNRTIVEAARAMLEEKSLPKFYWAEAVRTAVYIQNRIGDKVSAHELYFGTKPNFILKAIVQFITNSYTAGVRSEEYNSIFV